MTYSLLLTMVIPLVYLPQNHGKPLSVPCKVFHLTQFIVLTLPGIDSRQNQALNYTSHATQPRCRWPDIESFPQVVTDSIFKETCRNLPHHVGYEKGVVEQIFSVVFGGTDPQ